MKKFLRILVRVVLAAAVVAAVVWYVQRRGAAKQAAALPTYSYETVTRGDLTSSISASGTIEPEELIDVGSQVSGKILSFGTDAAGAEVDYCSVVTNGMVLARIDDVTYLADLEVARAQRGNAEAAVTSAKASRQRSQVSLDHARKNWERAQKIGVGLALSQSDYDSYQATYEEAVADLAVADAAVNQAEAQLVQTKASIEKAERNLGYCTITSPVDGIVVDRRVNLGQTVVSSMSVSSLFLVAKDLKHMRIWAAVNEADIGSVHEGQKAEFTVDTFGERTFRGTVRRVRLNATITSNVVTYTVEIDVDNPDGTLLPYLTANVSFITAEAQDALVVPARALRVTPPAVPVPELAAGQGIVWVADGEDNLRPPRPVVVKVVLTNGSDTAVEPVEANALRAGDRIITRVMSQGAFANAGAAGAPSAPGEGSASSGNPFMPNMPKPPKGMGPH